MLRHLLNGPVSPDQPEKLIQGNRAFAFIGPKEPNLDNLEHLIYAIKDSQHSLPEPPTQVQKFRLLFAPRLFCAIMRRNYRILLARAR